MNLQAKIQRELDNIAGFDYITSQRCFPVKLQSA